MGSTPVCFKGHVPFAPPRCLRNLNCSLKKKKPVATMSMQFATPPNPVRKPTAVMGEQNYAALLEMHQRGIITKAELRRKVLGPGSSPPVARTDPPSQTQSQQQFNNNKKRLGFQTDVPPAKKKDKQNSDQENQLKKLRTCAN